MVDFRAVLNVLDFFVPVDVLSAVLMVFALENVLGHYFSLYVSDEWSGAAWVAVYVVGAAFISGLNLLTADVDELEELSEDIEDI